MSRRLPELLTGFAVIAAAAVFLAYALLSTGEVSTGGYALTARFGSVGGLTVGSDVKIGGVIVGHVANETLDPVTYAAIVRLNINNGIKIPDDSSASITSDGLLGGVYVAVSPGGSNTMLAPGSAFPVTQSAINVQDLIGKFIFSMGGSSSKSPAPPSATPQAAP
ncbi:outer membrane lipid asymmetry maintenance protein MlaD [Acidocella aromatica]|uniref:Phospholipid/cholesterol/gamma-HCH transport system substrate-binding protein n=1 Tax=Acidocella aromatica TaxID=1303579 RepID=A0A840VBC4_9PROT|nr:outer membrane lipid asymmetry maintenance protein MlaD [Acidocella aromatica]MBB5372904.1 phospholipid/cholesterol/gamma-HCH transport system substrate-binding protein [Acidocella aromatica]